MIIEILEFRKIKETIENIKIFLRRHNKMKHGKLYNFKGCGSGNLLLGQTEVPNTGPLVFSGILDQHHLF